MEQEAKTGLRMYLLVPYNIMPIQKGIQGGHVAEQYAYEMIEELLDDISVGKAVMTDKLNTWLEYIKNHKTWIILNGGTTNNSREPEKRGSLNLLLDKLIEGNCTYSTFYEPHLNDALSSICFLADEKVWDFDTYPMYWKWQEDNFMYSLNVITEKESHAKYSEAMGGKQNVILKEIIYRRPLAV